MGQKPGLIAIPLDARCDYNHLSATDSKGGNNEGQRQGSGGPQSTVVG